MATELGTAYVSIVGETSKLEDSIKNALKGGGKQADIAGKDIGARISKSASKAMKDGWRPDQDIMAGIPNTKLDRIGARMGQVIGKGVAGGLKAKKAGAEFANSFSSGAGSVGIGKIVASWRGQLSGGALNNLGMLAGKAFSAGLTAAVGVGVAGAGLALTKGFNRLVTLDTAQYKLKALGKSTEEITDIVKTVTDSVTGTPFALDQAFATATQAIGAGTKDLKRFMTDVADAAGFAGVGIDRMGLIFNQIQAKGKLTGEEMMQLMEAGLPAKSWIQKSYDLTADQFDKMQQDGKVTMDMLFKAIEDNAGGMATKLGDTLQGSIDNMQTSIAKLGANFLSAVFGGAEGETEGMKDAVQKITEYLNKMSDWVNAHRDDIREFFTNAVAAAKGLVSVLGEILGFLKEHPAAIEAVVVAFVAWKSITGIAAVATAVSGLNVALGSTATLATAAYGPLAAIAAIIAGGAIGAATLDNAINSMGPDSEGGRNALNQATAPGMGVPGASRDPIFQPDPSGPNMGPNIPPNASRERRGLPPVSLGGGGSFVPGTAGRGYFNSDSASKYLDKVAPLSQQSVRDAASRFGLQVTSSYRPGDPGYHGSGRALDLSNGTGNTPQMEQFAAYMAKNYGDQLAELIYDSPTFQSSIKNGIVNPGVYGTSTLSQHRNHVHIAFAGGGSVSGPGSGTSDSIPARLSNGEHVLSSKDVKAMGGQKGVYGFRKALHFARGGAVSIEDMRTAGAIPAAAGSTAKAGESAIAGAIDMGGEVINGVIDQAASLAATAASAAVAGGTMGAGAAGGSQAAGAATQFAISMGTDAAKRGVTYGFDMLGIGADSLLQQLTPFGQPRWLSQDYTGFMPQQAITGALGELMSSGAQQAINPNTLNHGDGQGAQPGPIDNLVGSLNAPDTSVPGAMPGPGMFENSANSFLSTELAAPEAPAPNAQPIFKVDNIYTSDAEGVGRELTKRGRLQQMQYTGRPGP